MTNKKGVVQEDIQKLLLSVDSTDELIAGNYRLKWKLRDKVGSGSLEFEFNVINSTKLDLSRSSKPSE